MFLDASAIIAMLGDEKEGDSTESRQALACEKDFVAHRRAAMK